LDNKVHVKKGDTVVVLSGKQGVSQRRNNGKEPVKGKVLEVFPDKSMVLVEGVNMATKHKKPRSKYQQGGILHQEAPIHSSNVMVICNKCNKPTRVGKEILSNGQKIRKCKKCGEEISVVSSPSDK
jgi:large subunit ribosomal protein L24